MLTNFFSKSKPITILIVFAFFLGLLSLAFFNRKTEGSFITLLSFFSVILSIVLFINTKNNLSYSNSYVFLVFVLLLAILPSTLKINTALYANLTLLMFSRKVYSLQSPIATFPKLFDSGLWLGVSFLIEPLSLIFTVTLYLAIFLHEHFTFQTIIIPFVGFLTPLFFFFTYCFWIEETLLFFNLFKLTVNNDISIFYQDYYIIPLCLIAFTVLIGVIIKTPKALAVKNNFRKSWILVLFHLICALIILFIINNKNGSELLYLFFPSAVIIGNLIEVYENKWYSDVFLALLMCLAITMSTV